MTLMQMSVHCPICNEMYASSSSPGENTHYRCPQCGEFVLTMIARRTLEALLANQSNSRIILSYTIRKMQGNEPPTLDHCKIKAILTNNRLPSLREQENNLIHYLGNNSNPGVKISMDLSLLFGVVGSINGAGIEFVITHLQESGFLTHRKDQSQVKEILKLTMKGWERHEDILRGNIDSKKAFMAMPFNDSTLDEVYKRFKATVAQTGFDLQRIDEQPKAGLIDDRLRVEITTSRFLLVELTRGNKGAYWEAGFAEGLRKPVIYTCEKAFFKQEGTHFDTNHHLTIQWEVDKINEALDELKATIRATLPDEAKLQD
jgi:hypothetical protein